MPPRRPARAVTVRPIAGQRAFYRLATLLIVVGALYWAKPILVPFALALLLAFALGPVAAWLERRGLGRVGGSLVVSVAALGLLTGLGWVAGNQIGKLSDDPRREDYVAQVKAKFDPVAHLLDGLDRLGVTPGPSPAAAPDTPPADGSPAPVPVTIQKSKGSEALAWLPTLAMPAVEFLATALLVTVLTVFLLVQRESVRDRLLALAGRRQLTTTTRALEDAGQRIGRFLLLQAGTNAAMGLIVYVGLSIIGIPYAPLWGLLTAALRFIPYIGVWLSAVFPLALAVAAFPGWTHAVLVLALYAGFDLTMANVVEPLLFGHGTGVSSLALLVAAAFWAFLWGPVGLLLAVPLTVCLVVIGEHVPSLGFLRTLLGDEPQVDPAARLFHRVLSHQHDEAALLVQEQAAARPLLEVYDAVLLPAIGQAKTERDRGDLSPDEERDFYRVTRGVMEGVLAEARADAATEEPPAAPTVRVLGCSTKGEADRLALLMLRDVARPAGCTVEIVPAVRLLNEVRARVDKGETVAACIGAVSPGGLAQAAGLCKQLRARYPAVKVIVGRWGVTEDRAGAEKFLTAAGAGTIAWNLRETLAAVVPNAPQPASTAGTPDTPAKPGQVSVPA